MKYLNWSWLFTSLLLLPSAYCFGALTQAEAELNTRYFTTVFSNTDVMIEWNDESANAHLSWVTSKRENPESSRRLSQLKDWQTTTPPQNA